MKSKGIKTAFTLMLLSSMLIAGCGGNNAANNTANNTPDNTGNNTETNQPADGAMDTSPFKISFFGADASPNWNNMQDDVGKAITEKTGVTLEAEYDVGSGGGDQKIAMMAASGDVPDLIFAKGSLSTLVDAGLIIDLTELIDKYAPNLKKVYGENMNRLKYSLDDQSIYQIPTNMGVGQSSFDATGGFEIQHRVLKELGYPEVKTLADYEKVLKDYVALHPETDGQPTIPLTLNADDWKIMITVTNPAFITTGAPDDGEYYVDPETYEAQLHYKRPVEKEYFRWLNGMYNQGLLDKDTFVQKDDQYKAKVASGRVLGLISQEWEYQDGENALKAAGKDEYTYAHFPVTLSEEYKDHSFMQTGIDGYGLAITTAAKDPERIIKWLDWMSSDEGQILRNWGIEGKHYTVDADGKRVVPADIQDRKANDVANFQKETGIGQYLIFGARYGDGVKDPTGNYYTTSFPEEIVAAYSDAEKESLAGYGATTWKDLFPKEDEFPVKETGALYNLPVPTDGQYQVIFKKTQDIIRKRIPEAILSKPGDFDKVYDAFLAELDKAGAQDMEKEFTELVKKRVSLWTGKEF
ncbi:MULTISPECIES: ABC transporter substrate-binding protein [unclassified Paenibacillus]|uniref:ABC transporter substrate-binding protein n=1 Tax=unclassified Paenibacillus TaxID=185978 RepID=UPI002405833B|nr:MULTISPECIES: ABC transporter substrate-binding protein [unclassified Paenibacillus]MDF9843075.1 putative aldouronate transport system substrate-binding protein [Paenibacillus sp. PastF-2]MDF9849713.1 putative aldouronate transport system substrate-binding protein [Paenibacillus sp. PastM-2]MDF9856370.1 putative aldouronate transport system substrate-binding protein [Paenibacillus sp. PastF-1]MDH6481641.1 putative aldouronate transport system substrate-binding protein [Paenibacillus sp. Past